MCCNIFIRVNWGYLCGYSVSEDILVKEAFSLEMKHFKVFHFWAKCLLSKPMVTLNHLPQFLLWFSQEPYLSLSSCSHQLGGSLFCLKNYYSFITMKIDLCSLKGSGERISHTSNRFLIYCWLVQWFPNFTALWDF